MLLSILLLACAIFHSGYGFTNGILPGGGGAGPLGAAGGFLDPKDVVQKCDAPIDHSCDDASFSDIAGKIAGGGLLSGAAKGTGIGAGLGGLPSGFPGRRRRGLGLFNRGVANPAPLNPIEHPLDPSSIHNPLAPNPVHNPLGPAPAVPPDHGIGHVSSLMNVPGTNFFSDPHGMGPTAVQNKLHKCDENNKPGGQFDQMRQQLTSVDFKSLTDPGAINAGDQCKNFMDTEKDQCQMLKRQCCAFLNGGVKDISHLKCAFGDIMATSGKVHAKNSACDAAQGLMSNPHNAGGVLQNGAKGVGTGLLLNHAGNKLG